MRRIGFTNCTRRRVMIFAVYTAITFGIIGLMQGFYCVNYPLKAQKSVQGNNFRHIFVVPTKSPHLLVSKSYKLPIESHKQPVGETYTGLPPIRPNLYLYAPSAGRLGNIMYQYAAMFALAKKKGMTSLIHERNKLKIYFKHISAKSVHNPDTYEKNRTVVEEKLPCAFDSNVEAKISGFRNVTMVQYFQSWKYFIGFEKELRREFTFSDTIQNAAVDFLSKACAQVVGCVSKKPHTYIGVHIRRGDYISSFKHRQMGYRPADARYINQAVDYFRKKFKNLIFVVASDDHSWSRDTLFKTNVTAIYSRGHGEEQDMAILANCNHTIMTVGTYGWWAAFLAGGEVTYYKKPVAPNTFMDRVTKLKDFFYPNWVGF